jgi:hypothetical protein
MVERAKDPKPIEMAETMMNAGLAYSYRMQQMIKMAGGQLSWQYNAVNQNMNGWIRQVVFLGGTNNYPDSGLHILTYFDVYVKLPVLNYICKILNRLHKNKAIKECRAWDRKLRALYNKKGK